MRDSKKSNNNFNTNNHIHRKNSLVSRFKKSNLLIISIITVLLSVIAYLILDITATTVSTNVSKTYAENSAAIFSNNITIRVRDLENLSKNPVVINWFKNPTKKEVEDEMIEAYENFASYFGDANIWATNAKLQTQFVFDINNNYGSISKENKISKANPEDAWHYKAIDSRKNYVIHMHIDKASMEKSIWINYKVFDENNSPLGVLSISIPYEEVVGQSYISDKNLHVEYIIDPNGFIMITNDPDFSITTTNDLDNLNSVSIFSKYPSRVFQDYISKISNKTKFFTQDSPSLSFMYKDSVISVAPIVNSDWLIVKEESKGNYISINAIYWILFTFAFSLFIYSKIVNGATYTIILDPFTRLTRDINTKEFKKSSYDIEVFGSGRTDELGLIARSIISLKRDLFVQTKNLNNKVTYLRHNTDKIRRIYDVVPIAVLTFDTDFNLLSCNKNGFNLFNVRNTTQFTDNFIKTGYLKKHNTLFFERFEYAKIVGSSVSEDIIKISDKEEFWAHIQIFYLLDESGVSHYFEVFINDIQNSKENDALLTKQAYIDALTNVYNRNYFNKLLTNELDQTFNDDYDCGLLVLDIDNFKRVNDVYGHNVGDIVLAKVADVVMATKDDESYFFRWGGEEFLLFKAVTSREDMFKTAEKIREAIESVEFDQIGTITVSIGISIEEDKDYTFDTLFKRADEALYRAKRTGKNRSILYINNDYFDSKNNLL